MLAVKRQNAGLTMVELLVASTVLAIAMTGILPLFNQCYLTTDLSRNMSLAAAQAQAKIEEIRATDFDTIIAVYHNTSFVVEPPPSPGQLPTAMGRIEAAMVPGATDLMQIAVTLSWSIARSGHVFGEDKNLDGNWTAAEDGNGDGIYSSPVRLVTYLARRP